MALNNDMHECVFQPEIIINNGKTPTFPANALDFCFFCKKTRIKPNKTDLVGPHIISF
jgi:hypothetical protein